MIHLIIAFLILVFMCLMVIEPSQSIRIAYFLVSVLLFSLYNILHLKGIKISIDMLARDKRNI